MRNYLNGRGMAIGALALIYCIFLSAPAAQASTVVVTLSNWNQQQFNTDGDTVTVSIDNVANTLTVNWISGNPGVPNAIGIDKFFFNGQDLADPGYFAVSTGWNLKNGSNHNAGGFPNSYINEMDDPGGNLLSNVVFTFPVDGGSTTFDTDFVSESSFAAHVRYGTTMEGGTCSGFASNQSGGSVGNEAGCSPPIQTPETSSLLMLGLGLPLLAFAAKRISGTRN